MVVNHYCHFGHGMSPYECDFLYPYTSIHICPVTSYVENGQVFLRKKFKHKIRTACIKS